MDLDVVLINENHFFYKMASHMTASLIMETLDPLNLTPSAQRPHLAMLTRWEDACGFRALRCG